MNPLPDRREQIIGWILAGLTALHLFAFHPQTSVGLAAGALLLAGAVLRGRQIHAGRWLGNLLLFFGFVAVVLAQAQERNYIIPTILALLGELPLTVAAILLLRPVTPLRCQRVLFCLILVLSATILRSAAGVGQTLIVLDVAAMYLVLEEAFRPPDAIIGFWVSLTRSFRVIVPVGIVVLTLFWLFPSLKVFSPPSFTTFAGDNGSDSLDVRSMTELYQSHHAALTARFARDQPVPLPSSLYWRGQAMEYNDGFHWWSVSNAFITRGDRLLATAPAPSAGIMRYSQEIANNRGIIPVLDHAIFIEAKSNGQDIAIIDHGSGPFSQGGVGSLTLDIDSSTARPTDAPVAASQEGCLQVPPAIRDSAPIQKIAAGIFAGETGTPGKLRALSRYFQESGFRYTLRSGRIQDMGKFLISQRAGFCSHYAMAAANLLRLGQVPARVVTGYRGGEWNPWLRTITVRDSDAHAWVEAWDESSHRWLRFDPTDSVAPELLAGIRREMDSGKWPWYRRDWSYGRFLAINASSWIGRAWDRLTTSELWSNMPILLFIALVGVALFWLIRNLRARRAAGPQESFERLLLDLEQRAVRLHRDRKPGETPLAWLDRLARAASDPGEKEALRDIASSWETSIYKPAGTGLAGVFRQDVRRLVRLWKRQPL